MPTAYRRLIVAVLLLAGSGHVRAQTIDPSGHWRGTLQAPGMEVPFEVDLAKAANGQLGGTVSVPPQKISGLPLTKVTVEGSTVFFQARSDQPFTGVLSEDRQSIAGDFLIAGNSLPFALMRTGDAIIKPPVMSAAIPQELEGTWTAAIMVEGAPHHLTMTLVNHPDATASGRIVNQDEGGLELPVTIAQRGSSITIEMIPVASTIAVTLNETATELAGTITQGAVTAAVTFRRAR